MKLILPLDDFLIVLVHSNRERGREGGRINTEKGREGEEKVELKGNRDEEAKRWERDIEQKNRATVIPMGGECEGQVDHWLTS